MATTSVCLKRRKRRRDCHEGEQRSKQEPSESGCGEAAGKMEKKKKRKTDADTLSIGTLGERVRSNSESGRNALSKAPLGPIGKLTVLDKKALLVLAEFLARSAPSARPNPSTRTTQCVSRRCLY